jgi:hypothetical protein
VLDIPEVPVIAGRYETCRPDRIEKFPYGPDEISPISTDGTDTQWRHKLHHDTKSVFWLLYWVVGAQPEKDEEEPIDIVIWLWSIRSVTRRIALLRGGLDGATHSIYQPLWPLLDRLARILDVDRHWVKSSDPRKDPGYINEAFQRLILQFILEHRNEKFMQHRIESQPRRPEPMSGLLSLSGDASRNRSLSEPTTRSGTKRLRMAEKMIEVGRRYARCCLFLTVCFQDTPNRDESENQFSGEVDEKWVEVDEEE